MLKTQIVWNRRLLVPRYYTSTLNFLPPWSLLKSNSSKNVNHQHHHVNKRVGSDAFPRVSEQGNAAKLVVLKASCYHKVYKQISAAAVAMVNTPNKLLRAVAALSPFRCRGRESVARVVARCDVRHASLFVHEFAGFLT